MNNPGKKLAIAIALILVPAIDASAFHGGGTGNCSGCHDYLENTAKGFSYVLKAENPSTVCLGCHEAGATLMDYQVATADSVMPQGIPPKSMTPGGDFAWLKKNYTWINNGMFYSEPGQRHGHNIVAPELGYEADSENLTAPGGSYPAANLSCISCHDPHGLYRVSDTGMTGSSGKMIASSGSLSDNGIPVNPTTVTTVGTYRMLAGAGYRVKGSSATTPFIYDPPAAMAPSDYNRDETGSQTRVAYGQGVSLWCANCHSTYVTGGIGTSTDVGPHHAKDKVNFDNITATRYNTYLKTGDLGGEGTNSFLSLVPFESPLTNNVGDRDSLAAMARTDDLYLQGPTEKDSVNCLTCHRAHASGWKSMLRWNNSSPFLLYNDLYPGTDNGAPAAYNMGRTEAETRRAYYDRPADVFGNNQEKLCRKCHEDKG